MSKSQNTGDTQTTQTTNNQLFTIPPCCQSSPETNLSMVITRTILTLFAILGVCTANAQNDSKILPKDPPSITFTVDEGLSLPEDHFSYPVDANHIYYSSLKYCGVDYDNGYSLDDRNL